MPLIQFDNITKTFPRGFTARKVPAVRGLSFTISDPGITGFVGPNGAGKTTSIKILLGLVRPSGGHAAIRGVPCSEPRARRGVSFVPEQPCFYTYLTAQESLLFGARLSSNGKSNLRQHVEAVLATVGLAAVAHRKVRDLSKGMQQRLSLAHALVDEPEILIMDEPMSGLDPIGRRLFRSIFRDLAAKGTCIFFSTHILEDIEQLCNRIVVLSEGRLVFSGPLRELTGGTTDGTEFVVPGLTAQQREDLTARGFAVSESDEHTSRILVPPTGDLCRCYDYLNSEGVYPLSVGACTKSLESVLYREHCE